MFPTKPPAEKRGFRVGLLAAVLRLNRSWATDWATKRNPRRLSSEKPWPACTGSTGRQEERNLEFSQFDTAERNSGAVLSNMMKWPAFGMKTVLLSVEP